MPVKTSCQNATATFGIERITKNLDSTDGLAAAVCHFNSGKVVELKLYRLGCVCKTKRRKSKEMSRFTFISFQTSLSLLRLSFSTSMKKKRRKWF
jgi:hypothetical protein